MTVGFQTKLLTNQGGRRNNQDYAGFTRQGDFSCWVLADGLGGHAGGETASRLAVEAALAAFKNYPGLEEEHITRWLQAAQEAVLAGQAREPSVATMRTTLVIMVAGQNHARWAHIGDSRLYMFRGGRIIYQTRDHSVSQALADSGQIELSDIRNHEDRSRLLRTLGNEGDFRPVILAEPLELNKGDAFMICSDGFWEYILEDEMEAGLLKAASPGEWLEGLEGLLRGRVSSSNDNYTALAIISEGSLPNTWRLG